MVVVVVVVVVVGVVGVFFCMVIFEKNRLFKKKITLKD